MKKIKVPKLITGIKIYQDINLLYAVMTYPRWTKFEIKRKRLFRKAITIDIWQPYEKSLFDLLPKQKWDGIRKWRSVKNAYENSVESKSNR